MSAMKLAKHLLYDRENKHLDIARFSALLSVLGYLTVSGFAIAGGVWSFDPLQWGSGWAAICGGNAAWIFARQRYEARIAFAPTERRADQQSFDYMYSPRVNDEIY